MRRIGSRELGQYLKGSVGLREGSETGLFAKGNITGKEWGDCNKRSPWESKRVACSTQVEVSL